MSRSLMKIKSILKCTKIGTYLRKRNWNRFLTDVNAIDKTIDRYMGEISPEEKISIRNDILDMAYKYRFSAEEYFYYHFINKSEDERKTFISDMNRVDFCEKLNKSKNLVIFDDKMSTYSVFGKYYKRDVCCITKKRELEAFENFIKKHKRFILKPLSGTCGKGIQLIDMNTVDNAEEFFNKLLSEYCLGLNDGFIVEEIVEQVPEMAQFHPSSLNTIRVATVKFDEGVEVIASFFRTGRSGNIVDNAGAGGVFGTINIDTGIIEAVGDEFGNNYEVHPDSGIKMVGFSIPEWEEAKRIAKELALVVKGNRYAGWDLALTKNGWVMIEGNARGQFVWQIPIQKGFLNEANQILNRLGLPKLKLSIKK